MLTVYEGFPGDRLSYQQLDRRVDSSTHRTPFWPNLISFSNEFANLSTALGNIDAAEVMRGLHSSRYLTTVLPNGERIVPPITSFLMGGCGFGGRLPPERRQRARGAGATARAYR
ncbi:MAG: hypothetical protein WDO74_30775 [Pseudomonadota bacterium]